jgi:hypothetical protein
MMAGAALFFSIPRSFTSGKNDADQGSVMAKLAKIDYLGSIALVCTCPSELDDPWKLIHTQVATLVSLLYGLSSQKILWQPLVLSVFLLVVFVVTEVYVAPKPIIPVVVLKSRGLLLCCLAQLGVMSGRWIVLFYSPVYEIALRGWSPASAGSILIPTNVGFAMGGLLVGGLHINRGGSFWGYAYPILSEPPKSLLMLSE